MNHASRGKIVFSQALFFAFLLALFLVFPASVFVSAEGVIPKELGSTRLAVTQSWVMEFGDGGAPSKAVLEVYAFPQTPYQNVSYSFNPPASAEEFKDEFGNARVRFTIKPGDEGAETGKMRLIDVNAVAQVNYLGAPLEPLAAGEEERYLNETELTASNDEINALAASLTNGAADDVDAVARLTEWVNNNVVYDSSYWKQTVPASRIFTEKRGVCNQFATLLIALLHSQGIPARFAAGFVYSGESWGAHAWVEAGVLGDGGARYWMPVDPTFAEAGVLDAGHLKFAHGLDQNDIKESSSVGVVLTKSEPKIDFDERNNFGDLFDVTLNAPSLVGSGSAEEFAAAIKSKVPSLVVLPFSALVPSQPPSLAVRVADGASRLVYLPPGSEKAVSWTLVFPSDLKEGYAYNFSVAVQGLGKKASTTVEGRADVQSRKLEKLSITRFAARDEGARESFSIVVVNEGNMDFESVDVSGDFNGVKQRESFSLSAGEEKLVAFSFAKPELHGVYPGSFKVKDPLGGASAEQPFQLEITKEPEATGTVVNAQSAALPIPQDYLVYAAAVVAAAAVVFAVVRARKANRVAAK